MNGSEDGHYGFNEMNMPMHAAQAVVFSNAACCVLYAVANSLSAN
jgi:hypothetical protein